MGKKLSWCDIDSDYLIYLRGHDERIPFKDYGTNKFKPFFNPLFEVEDMVYVSQVTSIKQRHQYMKNNEDFFKIYDKKELLCVVNLNYMFPVPKEFIIQVNYEDIDNFRTFNSDKQKENYISILDKEIRGINKILLNQKAQDLYSKKYTYPDSAVAKRCLDFKALEQIGSQYNNTPSNPPVT